MKFAFMTFSTPELSLPDTLATAARLGYDGIEPRVACDHGHGLEYGCSAAHRTEARRLAAETGVAFACVATSCQFADAGQAPAQRDDARRAVDLAASLGAPCVRVFGGPIPAGVSRAAATDTVVASLLAVADQAQSAGVCLCMETHDDWCDPQHVAAVMQAANHPAVAANWDVMHPVRTGLATVDESFAALKPWIRHLHVHDGAHDDGLRLVPMGTGAIDHRRAIELLAGINYTGFLSGEWINWEAWGTHLPRELAVLRQYRDALAH
jgi:sugar phosphate isomerase/epimerase